MAKSAATKPTIGGQAVLEGVMMKSPEYMAIAVRKGPDEVEVFVEASPPPSRKHKWMGFPVIRGIVNFVLSLKMGMKTINKSADMLGFEEDEESRLDKWLREKLGAKAESAIVAVAMVLAVALAAGLFVVLPAGIATALKKVIANPVAVNLIEGFIRLGIFLIYIASITFVKDIRRVFQYHGAEHKTVHCYEHDEELTVENVRKHSTLHPRCGTAFLLIIMVISILFFSLFAWDVNWLMRVVSRLALLPVVAGVSYEVLRILALRESGLTRALRKPGMLLQKLTTREPDDEMIIVAIAAFKAAQTGNAQGAGEAVAPDEEERVLL